MTDPESTIKFEQQLSKLQEEKKIVEMKIVEQEFEECQKKLFLVYFTSNYAGRKKQAVSEVINERKTRNYSQLKEWKENTFRYIKSFHRPTLEKIIIRLDEKVQISFENMS